MVAQDNDAKHGDVNSRQEAYQEDDDLKLRNENIQEYKELHEQIQAYFSSALVWLRTHTEKTQRYIANLQSIFDFLEEKLQISQVHDMLDRRNWEYRTANTLHVTDGLFERFHAKVKQKLDRHLNETKESSQWIRLGRILFFATRTKSHQRKMMKSNEELIKLLQTETTHIVKMNEQSLKQAKPILRTSSN